MEVFNIKDMKDGWLIGDFTPSVLQTDQFEVGIKNIVQGTPPNPHYHKLAIEINYLIAGSIEIDQKILKAGDIFVFQKNEISNANYLEDCTILVIKTPSVKNDKYNL